MTDRFINFLDSRNNKIVDKDWWLENFVKKFLNSKSITKTLLNEKRMKASSEFISSRVLNHWQNRGLIDDDRPEGKGWRQFSPSEMMWLGIIIKLRNFGMDFEKIKRVKEYLVSFQDADKTSKFPELDFYIMEGLNRRTRAKLLVFESGETILIRREDMEKALKKYKVVKEDYISIDITNMFQSGIHGMDKNIEYLDFGITPIEKEIRDTLSIDGVKSVTISVKGKSYYIDKEILKKSKKEMDAVFDKLKYAKSTKHKRGGKVIYSITEKNKITKQ